MKGDDARLARKVRSEIIRRELYTQKLDVVVLHGVAYIGGELSCTRQNRIWDYKKEFEIIEGIIRKIPGIRDVEMRVKWVDMV